MVDGTPGFDQRVWDAVTLVPAGRLATYGH
ncbi:MGMT family protein [Synechococcus sp. EJ6-Ellesmere]|nr:MGMT family protein [Synechococcus sp. EJ6-Ellesmere]